MSIAADHPTVEARDGLVYKRGDPQVLTLEAVKSRLGAAIGEKSGLFSVPRVVGFEEGRLVTEYVPNLRDLREVAIEDPSLAERVFARAGRALAAVHQGLKLPPEHVRPLPGFLMSADRDNVALHGDFFWGNIGWLPREDKLVLLDWAAAPLLGGVATYGSRYFDLIWFSWSFFFWTPPRWVLRWGPERLVSALTQGYAETERMFEWKQYTRYRRTIRPLLIRYWKTKREMVPSSPPHTIAEIIGSLRWLLFSPGKRMV